MLSKRKYTKEKQTGCILLIAILLNALFSYSVPANSQPLQQATQIELLLPQYIESAKGAVNIYQSIENTKVEITTFSKIYKLNYLSFYERLLEVRFKNILLLTAINKSSNHFYPIKTIPQNSKEDSFILLIG